MMHRHEHPTPGPAATIAATLTAQIPTVTTERLTLSAPTLADFEDYASIVCTERGKYIGGPYARDHGWFDFTNGIATWTLHGHGTWAVSETASGRSLGFVALGLEPSDREIELGYLFLADAEGFGFASEAARAARDWGFEILGLKTLVSYIDTRNARSFALATRIGAYDDTPSDFPDDMRMYRHLPSKARV